MQLTSAHFSMCYNSLLKYQEYNENVFIIGFIQRYFVK